jgi:GTP-binding protein YchF
MKIGIVGLPNVGKTTIFNALTRSHAPSDNYPFCTIDPNMGTVLVPDQRLDRIAAIVRPQTVIPTHVEFLDVAGLVEGASRGQGLGNQFLGHIRETQLIAQVVRCFSDDDVAYGLPAIDPARELAIVSTELLLADLEVVEKAMKKSARDERKAGLLSRIHDALSRGKALRDSALSDGDRASLREFGLLSLKPLVVVANIGEKQNEIERAWVEAIGREARGMGAECITVCGAVEQELAELTADEAAEFLKEMKLSEMALPRFIRLCYRLLGLISFFTVEGDIVQAWAVQRGTTAPRAAGRIHTDMERGFIRAEVISFDELDRVGDMAAVRERGLLRIEGREYVVRDGDVIRFRFSV